MKEVSLHRMAGPFRKENLPFKNYIQSPIGLVPKDGGKKTRLIFHLSFDFPGGDEHKSVNHFTPEQLCTVKYNDLDTAIAEAIHIIRTTGVTHLFFSKTDCSSAFRLLSVLVRQRCWLLLKLKHPVTGVVCYFIDKCLPFGASISCALFQSFSDCLKHIAGWRIRITLHVEPSITNYLDDFLFMAVVAILCNQMLQVFLNICRQINCPINEDKTEWATQLIVFLGILLNGRMLTLSVPEDKKQKAHHLLQHVIVNKKVLIKTVQKLTGTLNFLNRAILPGRAFTRGMYQKLKTTTNSGQPLKQHHHVHLCREFLTDCKVWLNFLQTTDLRICRPFLDVVDRTGVLVNFSSDAAKRVSAGMGAVCGTNWMFGQWDADFLREADPSIEFLELYTLAVSLLTWVDFKELPLRNNRITIFCDNQAVVSMVNNLASSCKQCQKLIRLIALCGIKHNLRVFVRYVRSSDNWLSDALSRLDFFRFYKLAPKNMNKNPDRPKADFWPAQKIWFSDYEYLNEERKLSTVKSNGAATTAHHHQLYLQLQLNKFWTG